MVVVLLVVRGAKRMRCQVLFLLLRVSLGLSVHAPRHDARAEGLAADARLGVAVCD